nr:acylglycerol kinase, mitochondrial-like [Penaeus vannamei]
MMRTFCEEALAYGEITQPLGEKERHITVLLNPAAKEGKGKSLYEQYCAPLFHLAGIKVATVRTEHEGQAQDLMGVMENTSAVVVAGGDVLTGYYGEQTMKKQQVVCRLVFYRWEKQIVPHQPYGDSEEIQSHGIWQRQQWQSFVISRGLWM